MSEQRGGSADVAGSEGGEPQLREPESASPTRCLENPTVRDKKKD